MESYICMFLYIFAIIALTKSFECNHTAVDVDDPITIQLAQLDAIKCQIAAAAKQHTETLAAISSIRQQQPSTSVSDILLYIFFSLVVTFVVRQIFRSLWCYFVLKNDRVARFVIMGQRCMHLDLRPVSSHDLQEYRTNLEPPCLLMTYKCCVRPAHIDGVLEI